MTACHFILNDKKRIRTLFQDDGVMFFIGDKVSPTDAFGVISST